MTSSNPNDAISNFVNHVLVGGEQIDSRYGPCIEMIGGRLTVPSGTLVSRKGLSQSLGWMEMLQLLAGVFDLDAVRRVAPNANHNLFTYSMAYGPRIVGSIRSIIESLRENADTRQAVLFVGSPLDGATPDLPCTLTAQFLIRRGKIHAIVSMRSWDLCRGLPYDMTMFSGLLEAIGRCLNIPTGNIVVHSGSAHVYLDWVHRLPWTSNLRWNFAPAVPRNWYDVSMWAACNIPILEKGGVPEGVEVVSLRD